MLHWPPQPPNHRQQGDHIRATSTACRRHLLSSRSCQPPTLLLNTPRAPHPRPPQLPATTAARPGTACPPPTWQPKRFRHGGTPASPLLCLAAAPSICSRPWQPEAAAAPLPGHRDQSRTAPPSRGACSLLLPAAAVPSPCAVLPLQQDGHAGMHQGGPAEVHKA